MIKKELVQVSESGRKVVLSKEAKTILENHSWPGNIRELKRVFQLIAIDNKGLISKDDIEKHLEEKAFSLKGNLLVKNQMQMALTMGLPEFLEEIEKEVVNHALANNNHAIRKTLVQLKINQARLYKHIKSGKGELSEVH